MALPFLGSFKQTRRESVVLDAPAGCDQLGIGSGSNEAFYRNGGLQPGKEIEAQLDVLLGIKELKPARICLICCSHGTSAQDLQLMQLERIQGKLVKAYGVFEHLTARLPGQAQYKVCSHRNTA